MVVRSAPSPIAPSECDVSARRDETRVRGSPPGLSRYRYASFALLKRLDQATFQLGEMKLEFEEARQGLSRYVFHRYPQAKPGDSRLWSALWNTTNNMNNIGNMDSNSDGMCYQNAMVSGLALTMSEQSTDKTAPVGNLVDAVDYVNNHNKYHRLSTACVETCG